MDSPWILDDFGRRALEAVLPQKSPGGVTWMKWLKSVSKIWITGWWSLEHVLFFRILEIIIPID